jgi:HEAT repeat protein
MKYVSLSLALVLLPYVFVYTVYAQSTSSVPAHSLIEALIRDLQDKEANVRVRAADALYDLGPRASPAAKALVNALKDPDEKVQKHVIDTITAIGSPSFRYLAIAVRKGDTQFRLLVFDVLNRIGGTWNYKAGAAVKDISPALIDCISDKDPLIRGGAIRCLGILEDAASVPRLIKVLEEEKDIGVRANAILACGCFGERGKQAVPMLARIVVEEYDKELHSYGSLGGYASLGDRAAATLATIGDPAAPALARIVADVNVKPDIRCTVLRAVGLESQVSHKKFAVVVPAICQALADREEKVRLMAIYALRPTGSADQPVIAALQTATTDKSPRVRIDAAEALHRFNPQNKVILPTIFQALDHKEAAVRERACGALDDIGPKAHGAIPKLVQLMSHDKNDGVRLAAIKALGRMGPGIVSAIPILTLAANDPDQDIRDAAQESLKRAKQYAMKRP